MPTTNPRQPRDREGQFASIPPAPPASPPVPPQTSAEAEIPWEKRYHLTFTNFHRRALAATRTLLDARPSRMTLEERQAAFQSWVTEVSAVYGMTPPHMVWDEEADRGGGGYYVPAVHMLVMSPTRGSVITLTHELRHALQAQRKGAPKVHRDKEIDARAWSLSLYYQTKPEAFERLVRAGRVFHIDPTVFDV